MIDSSEITSVGKFQKTHALKGELNALLEVDYEGLDDSVPLIVDMDGIYVPFYVEGIRGKGQFASLVKLSGVDSEEDAKPFVNKTIYMLKRDLAAFTGEEEENGGYADDFVGYTIADIEAGTVGEIVDVDLATENALFLVESPAGRVYIPVSEDFIESIDEERKVITMRLPEGLLDINKK